jgi:hypothetical protein
MNYQSRQFLASAISFVGLLALSFLIWLLDNHKDYPGLEMSIQLILALVFANIFGIVSLATLIRMRRASDFIYWHNFVGILNFVLGALMGLFHYIDGVKILDLWYLWSLLSTAAGVLTLMLIYAKKFLRK